MGASSQESRGRAPRVLEAQSESAAGCLSALPVRNGPRTLSLLRSARVPRPSSRPGASTSLGTRAFPTGATRGPAARPQEGGGPSPGLRGCSQCQTLSSGRGQAVVHFLP